MVLSTPTAIKVAEKTAQIHYTHVKPLETADNEGLTQQTTQQTGNPLKLKLTKTQLDYAGHELFQLAYFDFNNIDANLAQRLWSLCKQRTIVKVFMWELL